MAKGYKEPALCNHYCSNECAIGRQYVPEVSIKDLRQIVIEMTLSLNAMRNKQNRLMEISVDNTVDEDQIDDIIVAALGLITNKVIPDEPVYEA